MNKIIINGKIIETNGRNVSINNNTVIIDGKIIQDGITGNINVVIQGDVETINCTGSVEVKGTVIGDIDCGGSTNIDGNVKGNIDCGGSCNCGSVGGNIDARGSVNYNR